MGHHLVLSCTSTDPLALHQLSLYGQQRLVISSLHLASARVAYLNGPPKDLHSRGDDSSSFLDSPVLSPEISPERSPDRQGSDRRSSPEFSWVEWLRTIAPTVEVLIVRHGVPAEGVNAEWSSLRSLGIVVEREERFEVDLKAEKRRDDGLHPSVAMARKRKTAADTTTECPRNLNEIPYIAWINKQLAAGRKPAGPLPEGIPSPGATSYQAPRDVPTRGRRDVDRVASSRVVDDSAYGDDADDNDYNAYAEGSDDEADSGEEEDKGMSDSDDDADGDDAADADEEAPEKTQPDAPTTRRGRAKPASAVKTAAKGGEQARPAPKTRNHIPKKRSVWSNLDNTTFVAACLFMKDELEPLLGKQGSQYLARLISHIEKENLGWVRDVNAVQKQWRNLVCIYKQLKKGEKASSKGALCKPPLFPYMELFQNNRVVANPHAVDGEGTTHVNVSWGFAVSSTSAPYTSTPTFSVASPAPPPWCAPPSKRPRVAETATMVAAKLVCKTIKGCHADAMNKLEGLVRAWTQQDERIARERLQETTSAAQTRIHVPADADT
ncbi:unnamed protein product [Closterium sp. Yama58-4]|nr:unnamed protein product [Closterium sp. Yama58-4]